MSVFTEGQPAPTTEATPEGSPTEDWVGKVVEDKGEKFRDPNEIAKGYAHSQTHIADLERQLAEMREDLGKKDYMQEVLDRIDSQKAKPSGGEGEPVSSTSTNNSDHKPDVSVDQIKTLIAETLTEQEATNTANQNLVKTDEMLTQAFGTDAAGRVESRRTELGMTKERMKQLAEESPSAFMTLMGEAPKTETNHVPSAAVNTAGGFNDNPNRKDWSYYQKMRKENSKLYYNPKTQRELFEQREKLGESAFYNR